MNPEVSHGGGIPAVDYSTYGEHITGLFNYITLTTGVFFVLVVAVLAWCVIAYRARPGHRAKYEHGTSRRDAIIAALLAGVVFLVLDFNITHKASAALEEHIWTWPTEGNPLRIEVLAQQWAWNIRYAGPDGRFGTRDDAVTLNDLRIPVDRPVLVNLRSKDVIHSFHLPNFRVKVDATPGTTTRVWFQARRQSADGQRLQLPAQLNIACAQMCGWAHYAMAGYVTVYEPADFERWYGGAVTDGCLRSGFHADCTGEAPRYENADMAARERSMNWGWDFEE